MLKLYLEVNGVASLLPCTAEGYIPAVARVPFPLPPCRCMFAGVALGLPFPPEEWLLLVLEKQ